MACCENERGSPLAHKSVQAWSRKFFNRNWKESLVSREAISFVFPRVQMFPEPKSRETSDQRCYFCESWRLFSHSNSHAIHALEYQAPGVLCFISRQFSLQANTRDFVLYCFVFLPSYSPTLGDIVWCHRVAERFIWHIIGCCLLLVHNLNKLASLRAKSELCFICVWERSWGISSIGKGFSTTIRTSFMTTFLWSEE